MRYITLLFVVSIVGTSSIFAYDANRWDHAVINIVQDKFIDQNYKNRTEDQRSTYIQKLNEKIDQIEDPRMIRMLWQISQIILDKSKPTDPVLKTVEVSPNDVGTLRIRSGPSYNDKIIGVLKVWDTEDVYEEQEWFFRIRYDVQYAWIAVEYTHLAGTDVPIHHLTKPKFKIADTWISISKQEFYEKYRPLVESKNQDILWLCTKYFDQIDEIAREYDFPVELIIATWYREHTCKFYNPGNGWGNFQITSNYYAPGDITRTEFRSQVIDFIEFSQWKREYYDLTQNFWPEPISLSYDHFDLASIRKHSIYYNGIVGELATNKYTNTNFNWVWVGGTDGIVTYFLKVLRRELSN